MGKKHSSTLIKPKYKTLDDLNAEKDRLIQF